MVCTRFKDTVFRYRLTTLSKRVYDEIYCTRLTCVLLAMVLSLCIEEKVVDNLCSV